MATSHVIWFLLSVAQIPGIIGTYCYHYDTYYFTWIYVGFCTDGCCDYTCCAATTTQSSVKDDDHLIAIVLGSVLGGIFFIAMVIILFVLCCHCYKAQNRIHDGIVVNRPPYPTAPAWGPHHAPPHHLPPIHHGHEVFHRPPNAANPSRIQMNPLPAYQPEALPPPPAYNYIPPPNGPLPPVPPGSNAVTPATAPVFPPPPENQNQMT
ncbi:uncharacterized protein [Argopecten irradians]|uniref:uncharacterized protein n=1 Tax=Argopecten irradians TaxID=31199 RepID=UPI003710DA0F